MLLRPRKIISDLVSFKTFDTSNLTEKQDGILVCLKLWDVIGQHPLKVYRWSNLSIGIYWVCTFLNLILAFCKFTTTNGDMKKITNTAESAIMFFHIGMEATHIMVFKARLGGLLSSRAARFWNLDDFDPETLRSNRLLLWATYALVRTFVVVGVATVTAMCSKPFVIHNEDETENLPFAVYIPNAFGLNRIAILCIQLPLFYYTLFLVVGLDMFYCCLCAHCLIQFRLISGKIESLVLDRQLIRTKQEEEKLSLEINKIANHHAYMLWFSEEVKDILSPLFLGQLMVTLLTNCIELYVWLESASSLGEYIYILMYLSTLYFDFGLYCFVANELSDATENVAESIYSSEWFFASTTIRKNLLFMMARAQRKVNFTACGLTYIKRETFTAVFKFSMSVLTLLRSMK